MRKTGHRTITHSVMVATTSAANTAYQLVSPAENVRGIIVRGGTCLSNSYPTGAMLAKATAPTGINDGLLLATHELEVNNVHSHNAIPDVFVPAGLGIYYFNTAAEVDARYKSLSYEIL